MNKSQYTNILIHKTCMFKEEYLQIYRDLASKYTSSQLDKVLNEITRCHNDLLNLPLSNSNTVLYRRASAKLNVKVKFTAPSSVKETTHDA